MGINFFKSGKTEYLILLHVSIPEVDSIIQGYSPHLLFASDNVEFENYKSLVQYTGGFVDTWSWNRDGIIALSFKEKIELLSIMRQLHG